jgi:hypothetical protein
MPGKAEEKLTRSLRKVVNDREGRKKAHKVIEKTHQCPMQGKNSS